jgi:carbonic anhydrase
MKKPSFAISALRLYSCFGIACLSLVSCNSPKPAAATAHETHAGHPVATDDLPTPHTPGEALTRLKKGNERYTAGKPVHPNLSAARIEAQYEHQTPFAAILSCSDSRVPIELLFDEGIGDIFTIRTAGESVTYSTMGSLEYAIDYLHVPLVVVMGHEHCGAVKNAIAEKDYKHFPEKELDALLVAIREDVPAYAGNLEKLEEAVKAHAISQVRYLKTKEPVTAKAVAEGKLQVKGAYFNIKTGKVTFLDGE